MLALINWRLRTTSTDGRQFTGQMLAFDKHMNLVLAECEEFRRVRQKKKGDEGPAQEQEIKRTLGLVILRGETIVSLTVEGPPPAQDDDKKTPSVRIFLTSLMTTVDLNFVQILPGIGRGMPAGRGMGMMPPSQLLVFPPRHLISHCFSLVGGPPPFGAPPGMQGGPPPGFRPPPPGFPPGMPYAPPPGFGGPPPG